MKQYVMIYGIKRFSQINKYFKDIIYCLFNIFKGNKSNYCMNSRETFLKFTGFYKKLSGHLRIPQFFYASVFLLFYQDWRVGRQAYSQNIHILSLFCRLLEPLQFLNDLENCSKRQIINATQVFSNWFFS